MLLRAIPKADGSGVYAYAHVCLGCEETHHIPVDGHRVAWEFNGSQVTPSFSPSVKHTHPNHADPVKAKWCCHYVITNGAIQYCVDSTHRLAGQTVMMTDIDEWTAARLARNA